MTVQAAACAFVGLGANLGDRLAFLQAAIADLAAIAGIDVVARSSVYETRPWGPSPHPFFNAVIEVATTLAPRVLLTEMRAIEDSHGRTRSVRWGERTLDLDLLLYGRLGESGRPRWLMGEDERLQLPHAGLRHRDFVLVPLCELAPAVEVAPGITAAMALQSVPDETRTILGVHAGPCEW